MWIDPSRRQSALPPMPERSGRRTKSAVQDRQERHAERQLRSHEARCREADAEIRALLRCAPPSR